METPRNFTVNGIARLGMSIQREGQQAVPLPENGLEFTGLAFAVHVGLAVLEKPQGRATLCNLGLTVAQEWNRVGAFRFAGDLSRMAEYVNEYLRAVRNDFPHVVLRDIGGPDVIAEAKRLPVSFWDGNLFAYSPKMCSGICFNHSKVTEMANASALGGSKNAQERKMSARYRSGVMSSSPTPPTVTFLNYSGLVQENSLIPRGESGRWLESSLFGGSLEFYRDTADDGGQAGIPSILDSRGLARKIHPDCALQLVRGIQDFDTFPFTTTGNALTLADRQSRGLISLGSTQAGSSQPGSFMRAHHDGPLFNVSAAELSRIPNEPGYTLRELEVAA
ncbi:hypothetical protein PT974_01486 [Cladobotryum mycophilum]|uniref:Uncharacterized protein n=1 Tax=Cladobotryum mycophilum TaxID=491253 RepID=A0ABR0T3Q9_9HYPO